MLDTLVSSATCALRRKAWMRKYMLRRYGEKGLVWRGEISSAGKEATLNTLIIAARLQTRPSWACVGAVMDTSDHYMNVSYRT